MRRPDPWLLLCVTACAGPSPDPSWPSSGAGPTSPSGGSSSLGGSGSAAVSGAPELGGSAGAGAGAPDPGLPDPGQALPFAPAKGKTALLIGQSGRRAHLDYVLGTQSIPAGGSVYAELYTGKFLSFEQAAFVDYLARYYPGSLVEVGLSWKDNRAHVRLGCDSVTSPVVSLPPEADLPANERLLLLGNNRCVRVPGGGSPDGGLLEQSDCSGLSASGQGRFHLAEQGKTLQIWSDVSWLCWSAEGDDVVQRACSEAKAQRFAANALGTGPGYRDVQLVASDRRCVAATVEAPADAPLTLRTCDGSNLQTFRL